MTQGVVSFTYKGEIRIKAIAGCNGFNAEHLAKSAEAEGLTTIEQIYAQAILDDFGCANCLVVMDSEKIMHAGGFVPELYRKTFSQPEFNPRWDNGTAPHVVIVEIAERLADEAGRKGE